ncbi:hypothetical protein PLICRDRAFT_39439 [Plicaturopsis crispa FD-325 SS-3]|nr:hypothetical protein PLICRDRAFT_39439 [Plicaturopsis crispa FD-325 SS-3]
MNQDEVVQFKTEYQDQALSFSAPSVDHGIIDLATIPHSTSHAQSPSSAHAEHVHFSPDGQLQSGAGTSTPFTPSRGLQNNKLGFSSIHPIVSSSISPLSAKTPCYPKISPLMLEGRGKENIPPYPMLDLQYPPLRNIRPQPSNQSSDAELFPRLSAHLNAFSGGHNMNVDMVSRSGPNSLSSILASISSDSTLVSSASSASPFNTTSALTICDYASSSGLLPPSSKEPPAYPNDSDMLPPSSAPSSPTSEYRNIGIITRRPAPNVLDESEEIPTSSPPTSVFDEWIPTEPATSSSAEPPRLGFSSTMKLKARNLLARTSTEINMLDSGSLPSPSDPAEGGDGMPTHSSSLPPGYHAVMNLTGREYHSPSFAVEPPSPEQPACIPSPPSGMPAYMRRKLSLGGVQRLVDPKLMEDPFEAAMSLVYLSTIGLEWDSGSGS